MCLTQIHRRKRKKGDLRQLVKSTRDREAQQEQEVGSVIVRLVCLFHSSWARGHRGREKK